MVTSIKKLEERIAKVKASLVALGDMRPGSLSEQYNVCGGVNCRCKDPVDPKKHGPYFQLSYVHNGKSTSEFVKKDRVAVTKAEVKNYAKFKKLTDEWVDLSVQLAKARKQQAAIK